MGINKILMKPPKWLARILERIPAYRGWYIKQVCHILHDEVVESFKKDTAKEEKDKWMDAHCPWYFGQWKVSDNCDKTCPITSENRDTSMCPECYDDDFN